MGPQEPLGSGRLIRDRMALALAGQPMRFLLSYFFYKRVDLNEMVPGLILNGRRPEVFGDSGAFSAHTQGAPIDIDDYINWIRRHERVLTVYANLDVIGDHSASARNLEYMEQAGLRPLPVFHLGQPWQELHALAERYDYICIGGRVMSNNNRGLMAHLTRAFQIAGEHGGLRYHGFAMTSHEIVRAFPWYSVDSSSWVSGAKYGSVLVWDPISKRMWQTRYDNPKRWAKVRHLVRLAGFDPDEFTEPLARGERPHRALALGLSGMSWLLYSAWLAERHNTDTFRIYLAEFMPRLDQLKAAREAVRLYLAGDKGSVEIGAAALIAAMRRITPQEPL